MSRAVTNGLPGRPLTFAEMGTYDGTDTEILLTPFWAWLDGDKADEDEDTVVSIVCTHSGGVSCLGFDAEQATWNVVITISDCWDFGAVPALLDSIEQWLFARYPLEELVRINTEPLDFLSSESSLGA